MAVVAVWVREAVSGRVSVCEAAPGAVVRDLLPVSDPPVCDFYVKCNGRRVCPEEQLQGGVVYSVEPRLCGGKGGFGSMLRALGAQIEKTTNREACRDLSGRRLRDVNHEKAMAEWIKKQAEREAEKEQRRLERLKRKLAEPKHFFTDPEYHQQCSDMSERLEDSVIKGLQASSSSAVSAESSDTRKRRKEVDSSKKESGKKKCFWTGLEGLDASSSSDSESESDSESPSTSTSCSSSGQRLQTSDSDSDGPAQHSYINVASERSPESSREGSSMAADVEQAVCKPEEQPQSSCTITEPREAGCSMQEPADVEQPICDTDEQVQRSSTVTDHREAGDSMQKPADTPDEQAQSSSSITTSMTSTEHRETTESMDVEQPNVNPEPEKPPPATTDTQQEAPHVDPALFNLLAFTSASELEALGLEKLKVELMALGLKCGGTLQERAARLFSVRGLTREQMDPSLFAKPSKGKKK
ncbi:splicing regulator SDE2 [Leptodactylus fuscus]|uniref:splicing regulator SDE2 n=1 Tax=Leptodactylus fuscus TaxID=238119 RepID=UPI003F4F0BEC